MTLEVLSAVGAVVQVVKTLYEYYNVHKRNKALLDILEGFSTNLTVSIERLQKRDSMLTGKQNPALDSIQKDFENARTWLLANDRNLRSAWTALQASDKLQDLDSRLMKAFASKMGVAIFSALQDNREATTQIQSTLDGMQGSLEVAVREASRKGLQEAIKELKDEAYSIGRSGLRGNVGGGGFTAGEAEKIISQLVDQLSAQERLREEEEALALDAAGYHPLISPPSSYDFRGASPSYATSTSNLSGSTLGSSIFAGDNRIGTNGSQTVLGSSEESNGTGRKRSSGKAKGRSGGAPPGSIVFSPLDPVTSDPLVDPVLANDGLIHDRWSLVTGVHSNVRDPAEPLLILGDVVQLREAIFQSYPERRSEFQSKRQEYREETIRLYDEGNYDLLPLVINRLSHVLLWEHASVSLRIRRGIAKYRLRDLKDALRDLDEAAELSTRGVDGVGGQHAPDVDALRARALVKDEMHDSPGAKQDIETVLAESPDDILVLSLRAQMRGTAGDLKGAQEDLAATNSAVTGDRAYRSRIGDADCDLEYLSRGWAYSSVGDFSSATADFEYALGLRGTPDPYTLACRGLAKVNNGLNSSVPELVQEGLSELNDAIELVRTFADAHIADVGLRKHTSGANVVELAEDGLPAHAFGCFFLRGMAFFAKQDFSLALSDFDHGMRLRPEIVKDTGEFRFALGQLRAETGDKVGAARDFDFATALKPEERFIYNETRRAYGL